MTGHEDEETLAALAEGTLAPSVAERVRAHLAECRSCTAAHVDAVRYRAAWLAEPEAFALAGSEHRALARRSRGAASIRRRAPLWLVAAALLVVSASGTWLVWRSSAVMPGLELPPALAQATGAASSRGLVLPGGERFAAVPAPAMRSGGADPAPELEREVEALLSAYEGGDRGAESCARLVAGLLATNDLVAARDYAREGLSRYPDDLRLLVLQASVLHRSNDLAGAEALLRQARRRAPADPTVTLDLAILLRQRGEFAESAALFERVARSRVAPLAERARRETATRP